MELEFIAYILLIKVMHLLILHLRFKFDANKTLPLRTLKGKNHSSKGRKSNSRQQLMNLQCMATKHSMKCLGWHEIYPTKYWPKPQKHLGKVGDRN